MPVSPPAFQASAAFGALAAHLHGGTPQTVGPLTLLPLFFRRPEDAAALPMTWLRPPGSARTLTAALADRSAEIVELGGGGDVPTLLVKNHGSIALLLLDGEELVGAKQNRILNTSVLVGREATQEVPVSCVEQGRWRSVSHAFTSHSRSMPAGMRRRKTERVTSSLMTAGSFAADQRAVWQEVTEYATLRGVSSATGALGDVFEADRLTLEEAQTRLPLIPGQVGIAAWLHGRLVGVELLFSDAIYAEAHGRITHSYAAETLGLPLGGELPPEWTVPEASAVLTMLEGVLAGEATRRPAPGLGSDVRVGGTHGSAAALLDEQDRLVHLVVYAA